VSYLAADLRLHFEGSRRQKKAQDSLVWVVVLMPDVGRCLATVLAGVARAFASGTDRRVEWEAFRQMKRLELHGR
jgi:hypothetical protein